ncbi:hypothetical protein, partial [Maridesulfovibrio ferrireducens]|uniref:hypothetical protein n=1 Tax=Maridesulfovibrio ferrireducens TaxID=246191 RepID=UPI001A24FBD6
MDNLMTCSNLRRDDCTGEILFRGRWYSEEEYFELQNDRERDEHERDCEVEARTEDKEMEESWA